MTGKCKEGLFTGDVQDVNDLDGSRRSTYSAAVYFFVPGTGCTKVVAMLITVIVMS